MMNVMTYEKTTKDFDPFYSLAYDRQKSRAKARKDYHGKMKSKEKQKQFSLNKGVGKNCTLYLKKMLHRQSRRDWMPADIYKKSKYTLATRWWDIT